MNKQAVSIDRSYAFQDEVVASPGLDSGNSIMFPQHRLMVTANSSVWMERLGSRFQEVVSLPKGWDGYGGLPVSFATARFAATMIERLCVKNVPAPSIIPGSDGSLQVEWHAGGYDIELDVQGPNEVDAYRLNQITQASEEIQVENDFSQVASWIAEMALSLSDARIDCAAG